MGLLGIIAYLCEMYIRPQDWLPSLYAFPLVDVVSIIVLIIALFSLFQSKRPIGLPQVYFVIFYLIMVLMSNILNGRIDAAMDQIILYAKRAAVFFMFLLIIRSTKQLKVALSVIIFLTVILSIQSLYQMKSGIGLAGQPLAELHGFGGGRAAWVGAWDGPNVLCLLFVIGIGLSMGFLIIPKGFVGRFLNIIFIITMIGGVFVTNSRGGFIGLLASIFVMLWITIIRRQRGFIKITVFALSLVLIMVGLRLGPSRVSVLTTKEESAHERSWLWEVAINNVVEKPFFGIGKGQFRVGNYTAAHNNFVQNMAEMGLPGLFIYMSLIYLSLKGLNLVIKRSGPNKELVSLSTGLLASMAGYAVTTFFVTMELDILFAWFGLCAASVNIARMDDKGLDLKFSLKDAGMVFAGELGMVYVIYLIAMKEII